MNENKSEVARLLQQIGQEYEAAQRGLSAYTQSSRHDFITVRMEKMSQLQIHLAETVGLPEASRLVANHLNTLP